MSLCASKRAFCLRRARPDYRWTAAAPPDRPQYRNALLAIVCAVALASGASPAAAYGNLKTASARHTDSERGHKQAAEKIPKGPLQIIISINQQRLHLYSDGVHVADAPIATGVPEHPTPLGIFSIIQKSRNHHSNIYSNAPMPFMERITWSGVALHEGANLGHPASHGCVRMSHDFAVRLWALARLGTRVVIARPELQPEEIADPHLFAHIDKPPDPAPEVPAARAPEAATLLKTAATVETDNATDAARNDPPNPIRDAVDQTLSSEPAGADGAAPALEPQSPPTPPSKPAESPHIVHAPIAIFVSGKDKKIYVRQNFTPLFDAPISIEDPDRRLGTYVFTAMEYLDGGSNFRWNVIAMPSERPKLHSSEYEKKFSRYAKRPRDDARAGKSESDAAAEAPQQALARLEIPPDVVDRISELIVPGSSLIISDQGLGEETGEGTDFIVVRH
jgi:lipoprotein-anchoring transpeptidase ErfK/SrfK